MSTQSPIKFSSLQGLTDEEIKALAAQETPKPVEGTWILVAPNGREYTGETPLKCILAEQHERIPAPVALARIYVTSFLESDDEGN